MTYFPQYKTIIPVLFALLLTACSGGESGTGLGSGNQPVISFGAITGFGSVFVNGIEFDTNDTEVFINDTQATEQQLSTGMVVAVVGASNRVQSKGRADRIYYEDEVRGIVVSNEQAGSLDIMGQSVNYDAETLFESNDKTVQAIADIPVGAVVAVSGYRIGENMLHATQLVFVDYQYASGEKIIVKGIVDSVNGNKFTLGNLTVVTDSSTQFAGNISNQQLIAGMNIKVTSQRGLGNNELQADKIQLNKSEFANSGASVDMEGIISNLDSKAGQFWLNGYLVSYSGSTELEVGNALADGQKAEVEGVLISDNRIEAKEIKVRSKNNTHIIGRVNTVDAANSEVSILGVNIQVTKSTTMKDKDLGIKTFSLTDVYPNDKIEIKAHLRRPSNAITAIQFIRLEADSTDTAVELKGALEQYSSTEIMVAGVRVNISALSSPPGISDADLGRVITVKGTALDNANEITATEISK